MSYKNRPLKDGWYIVYDPCCGFVFRELRRGWMYTPDLEPEYETEAYRGMIIQKVLFSDDLHYDGPYATPRGSLDR